MKKKKVQKQSLVSELIPLIPAPPPNPLTSDGTAVIEFSFVMNENFSKEIIGDTSKLYDFEKLKKLKNENKERFLQEAEKQINNLWHGVQALATHTNLFIVTFEIAMGKILNEVEDSFSKKSEYIAWLKDRFGDEHIRYFQHAKQLDKMGPFSRHHAPLGKYRLLEFDRLRKSSEKSFEEILKEYPFPDTSFDMGGKLFPEHIDGIITHERFKKAEVDTITFEDSKLLACYNHRALEVNVVKKVKEHLDQADDKREFLDKFLMDKMTFEQESTVSVGKESLNKLLARLDHYREKMDLNDSAWLANQRAIIAEDLLLRVSGFLKDLIEKFGLQPDSISAEGQET